MRVEHLVMNALRDLDKLQLEEGPRIVITKCGGFFRARFAGQPGSTLGATEQEALQRLSRLHKTGTRTPNYRLKERT
jgi:hypothetical protein